MYLKMPKNIISFNTLRAKKELSREDSAHLRGFVVPLEGYKFFYKPKY